MWPWGHAAVGYLLYTTTTKYRNGRPPEPHPVVWLLFGTQFPDLVDKPLVWYVDVLPYGRSLAHSLVFLLPLCLALYLIFDRRGEAENSLAFTVGAISHAVVDVLPATVAMEFEHAYGLLWPVLPLTVRPEHGSFTEHLLGIEPTPYVLFQLVLTVVAGAVWRADGLPGAALLQDRTRNLFERLLHFRS